MSKEYPEYDSSDIGEEECWKRYAERVKKIKKEKKEFKYPLDKDSYEFVRYGLHKSKKVKIELGLFRVEDLKEERLSRAKWAKALAKALKGRIRDHPLFEDTQEGILSELLRVAEEDEGGKKSKIEQYYEDLVEKELNK